MNRQNSMGNGNSEIEKNEVRQYNGQIAHIPVFIRLDFIAHT